MAEMDFSETFAPMAKVITIRCIFPLGATHIWEIYQMGVKEALLNRILEVKIYIDKPKGFA